MAELPFVEKYRPESLTDVCGDSNIKALKAFVRSGNFPLAIIFHGEFGTGKTTAAKAMIRDYYVRHGLYLPTASFRDIRSGSKIAPGYEGIFPPVLYVDAAVTRDIDMIRGLVQTFMKSVAPKGLLKFVVFDEADRLGYDAQGALRALIEKYPNTRTVYTANELSKIDPAIQSRAAGGVFEFKYPPVDIVATYLKGISAKESLVLPDESYATMAETSESVREAVGKLGTEIAIAKAEEMPLVPPAPEIEVSKHARLFHRQWWVKNIQIPYLQGRLEKVGRGTAEGIAIINQVGKLQAGGWDEVTESAYQSWRKREEAIPTEKPMSFEEMEPIYDKELDKWLQFYIELLRPGFTGELHYDVFKRHGKPHLTELEKETIAKFTVETIRRLCRDDIEKDKQVNYRSYLNFQEKAKGDVFLEKYLPDRMHRFGRILADKTERLLFEEAKAKVTKEPSIEEVAVATLEDLSAVGEEALRELEEL